LPLLLLLGFLVPALVLNSGDTKSPSGNFIGIFFLLTDKCSRKGTFLSLDFYRKVS
jgi:hypothetical protein